MTALAVVPREAGLAAVASGEPGADERFYRQWAETVLRWVLRLGGPALDHEDVAQTVLLTALSRAGAWRGGNERAWVFGVTRGVVANARRRAWLRRVVGLDTVAEPVAADLTDEAAVARQRRRLVQEALEALPAAQREVIVLADLEGHTAPEVAEMLQIPVGTVYSRQHAGRRALGARLAALAEPPGRSR